MKVIMEEKSTNKNIEAGDFVRVFFKKDSVVYPDSGMYLAVNHSEFADGKLALISLSGDNSQGAIGSRNTSLEERLSKKSIITHYEVISKDEYSIKLTKEVR